MKKLTLLSIFILLIFTISSCSKKDDSSINITASDGLQRPLQELEKIYEEENDVALNLIFEDSGKINKKIDTSKNIDFFITADTDGLERMLSEGKIQGDTFTKLLTNTVVLIANKNVDISSVSDLQTNFVKSIAMPEPGTAALTSYSNQILDYYDLLPKVSTKFIYSKDISTVFDWVKTGTADVGFVYKSDLYMNNDVRIVEEIISEASDPTYYYAGIPSSSNHCDECRKFFDFINSPRADSIFEKYNFNVYEETNK